MNKIQRILDIHREQEPSVSTPEEEILFLEIKEVASNEVDKHHIDFTYEQFEFLINLCRSMVDVGMFFASNYYENKVGPHNDI